MKEDRERQVDAIFQAKRKVYCGTCGYDVPGRETPYDLIDPACKHPHARETYETYEGLRTVRVSPGQRNAHNDCQDWQPATFFSDLGHNPFKMMLCLLALGGVVAWLVRICLR